MKINLTNIKKAKKLLNKSECVAIPTETVYGIAGNAYSDTACKRIFKLKKRPKNNPLIVHYYDLKNLKIDCDFNDDFIKLYKKFCPGPITFILNLKTTSKISKFATNHKNTLAAPSANISTRISAVTSSDVKDDFGKKIKYVLDGGKSFIGIESTIVDLRKKPKILRLGALEVETIQKILKKKISININPSRISTPGQSNIHYSPGIPIRVNFKKIKKNEALLLIKKKRLISQITIFYQKKGI